MDTRGILISSTILPIHTETLPTTTAPTKRKIMPETQNPFCRPLAGRRCFQKVLRLRQGNTSKIDTCSY